MRHKISKLGKRWTKGQSSQKNVHTEEWFFFSRAKEENEKPKQLLILKEVREMGKKKK